MERQQAPVALLPESQVIDMFIRECFARRLGFQYQPAKYRGICALSGATIKPFMLIGIIEKGVVVRKDVVEAVSVRGFETGESVMRRFRRWDETVAREWLAETGHVLLFSSAQLKPMYCTKVEDFKKLRSSVCMLRRI